MTKIHDLCYAITGASGFVGQRIIDELINLDAQISILWRSPQTKLSPSTNRLSYIEGDLSNSEALQRLIIDCDVVFHLAAYVHKSTIMKEQKDICYEVNYLGTKNLIDACIKQNQPPFIVLVSSVAVYGESDGAMMENQECNPITIYGKTKLAAEKYLLNQIDAGLIKGCVLRPSAIIGENAPGNINRLINIIDKGIYLIIDGGMNKKSFTFVDTVVQCALLTVEKMGLSNRKLYNGLQKPLEMQS